MRTLAIGEMRYLIVIEQCTEVPEPTYGEPVPDWPVFARVRAAKDDLSGREFFQAQQINAEITTRFRIRYLANITSKMRILCDGDYYNIVSPPIDPDGMRRELHLMTKAVS